jgi:uncharacterized protein YukJ
MVVENYGVWTAKPIRYTYQGSHDDPVSPHLSLYFADDEGGEGTAAINIKSGDLQDSRLAYWTISQFTHPITEKLPALDNGFHLLAGTPEQGPGGLALDFIRGNLFQRSDGRILPHDVPGPDNDILDELKPILDRTISRGATVYIYGSSFGDGKGVHNIHMNQGNSQRWARDNGVFQDGALIFQFVDHWEAVFLAFASQAIHTEDGPNSAGQPLPKTGYVTWADFLAPELPEADRARHDFADSPVFITDAIVKQPRPHGPKTLLGIVVLRNRTDKEVDLSGWKVVNKDGETQEIPLSRQIDARAATRVKVPFAPLLNKGGIITLLDAKGLKVHGVSYTEAQAQRRLLSFIDSQPSLQKHEGPSQPPRPRPLPPPPSRPSPPARPIPHGFIKTLDDGRFLVKTRNVSPAGFKAQSLD